jgi:hypothetical protein
LSVPLPAGATGVTLPNRTEGLEYDAASGTVFLNSPIRPGASAAQATVSFRLPFDGRLDFAQTLPYPVGALSLLAPETGLTLQGTGLQDLGLRATQAGTLRAYGADDWPANQALAVEIVGLSRRGPVAAGTAAAGLLIGLAAAGAVAGAVVLVARRRTMPAAPGDRYEALLQQVADLDDAFAAGELEPETYREQRARLKRQLQRSERIAL